MSEEQEKRPATISREEIFRQVWETPIFGSAKSTASQETVSRRSATD